MSVFERLEFEGRLAAVRARMDREGLDLLVVTVPENIYYLSGYAGWSFYTTQALLVGSRPGEPILVVRDMDTACAAHTAFLNASSVVGYPEEYVGGALHPMDFIARVAKDRIGELRQVAVERDGCFLTIAAYERLRSALDGAALLDAGRMVNWLRTVKSPSEVAILRQAALIAGDAMEVARQHVRAGARECDVAAEVYRSLIRGRPEFGGSTPASLALVSGVRTGAPHIAWTDKRIQEGTSANLELGGSRNHYHAGLARTFYLGAPPASLARLADTVVEGMDSALAAMRPGNTCEDVEAAWRRVISAAGYVKPSRIGYSIGIGFQPTWIDETASLQAGDRTVLEPNMTFHMICGMWKGADNVAMSETVLVTRSGCEVLTGAPRALLVRAP